MTKRLSILERTAMCLISLFCIGASVCILIGLITGDLVPMYSVTAYVIATLCGGLLIVSTFGMVMVLTGRELWGIEY